jgi:hypothetical protein
MEAACHPRPDNGIRLIKGILSGFRGRQSARMSVCGIAQSHYRNDAALTTESQPPKTVTGDKKEFQVSGFKFSG